MAWVDGLGFCASFAVLASFCMTTIVPLRACALASNLLFCAYGVLAHIYPVMFLHMLLLPINLVKLWRLRFPCTGGTQAKGTSADLVGDR
jgi:hypothetical protein